MGNNSAVTHGVALFSFNNVTTLFPTTMFIYVLTVKRSFGIFRSQKINKTGNHSNKTPK
jgi:hypothetical protein